MSDGKCIQELERIKEIRKGSAGKVSLESDNLTPKITKFSSLQDNLTSSQKDLATEIGLDERQLRNYKQLNDLIPELQTMA